MRFVNANQDGLAFVAGMLFLVVGFLWAFGCGPPPQCTLTVLDNAGGTIQPNGGTYSCGSEVTLTATPNGGWTFLQWSGDLSGGDNPAKLIMDTDKTVFAVFLP